MRARADAIAAAALDLGGTLSGEHGIGTDKVRHMPRRFGAIELAAFRAVKQAFDPAGILSDAAPAGHRRARAALLWGGGPRRPGGEDTAPEAFYAPGRSWGIEVDAENLVVRAGDGE